MDDYLKQEEEAIEQVNTFTEGGRKVEFIYKLMERLKKMLDFSIQFDEQGRMRHIFDEDNGKIKERLEEHARRIREIFDIKLENVSQMENDRYEKTRMIEGMFNPTVVYHGYEMAFLKNQKAILLPDPVKLQKTKYGIQISHLTDDNIQFIKNELDPIQTNMPSEIPMKRLFYLRATDYNWYDSNGNIRIPSDIATVKIKMLLQGYKIKQGIKIPVWRLIDVFDS